MEAFKHVGSANALRLPYCPSSYWAVSIDICRGGQGLARLVEGGSVGNQGVAVHRHSLDRLNAINDSLKKKKCRYAG